MKNFNTPFFAILLFLFFFWVQLLIPSYSYAISNVELLLLFIFIFLLLNLYNFLKTVIANSLKSYKSELKISIKKEVYLILIYLVNIQSFFKIILNLYCLMFSFFKKSLLIYKKQISILYNLISTLINYLYLNFLITIYLESLNTKTLLVNAVKNYNLKFVLTSAKLSAINKTKAVSSKH